MLKRTLALPLLALALAARAAVPNWDFSPVAEKCGPWVVNISTSYLMREVTTPFGDDPFFNFFDMPMQGRTVRRQSLGSGLIISPDGQVLTNAHVVSGADEITVTLWNGESYPAKVLGSDEKVDLAVLSISPKQALNAAVLGDSDTVKVGQWAVAIGIPLGFDHSVTVGVISAKGRTKVFGGDASSRYQNFLQTDASINQGNSGGPLCNVDGEVIGINSAIATPNQGSVGLGFAIPINMVKRSIPDLVRRGRVVAPQFGFFTQDVTPQLAQALRLDAGCGVLVSDVAAGGAAAQAGLLRGDVIVAIGDTSVASAAELKSSLYERKPGEPVLFRVLRKNQPLQLTLVGQDSHAAEGDTWHGLQVQANSRALAQEKNLAVAAGVVVAAVAHGSSAEEAGLMPGDVVLELNQKPVRDLAAWRQLSDGLDEDKQAVLRVVRGRQMAYVALRGE
jgi:serine protease Do